MHPDGDNVAYGILKMSVPYAERLDFWRMVEQRYQDRKRRWLEANARLVASRLAAIRARKEMNKARREMGSPEADETDPISTLAAHGASPSSLSVGAEPTLVSPCEEFSDVDSDIFADPDSRYYSSLDLAAWQRMRQDLVTIHRKDENPMEQLRAVRKRKWILVYCIVFTLVAIGLFVIIQLFQPYSIEPLTQPLTQSLTQPVTQPVTQPLESLVRSPPPCSHCDSGSILDEIIEMVIPGPNMDDQL
ncbi:uncharacterized protein LOC127844100 [Dreissena polymorpha]|uniref:Uncharacterized protein n=1 Tax=Dreissena polymorpha TaxID=45954 RepID=A0A9D4ICP2_DREPO|nr:uncharacterized protein LOC127844100 [Dreissena polymorpha]KAH3768679.1 hypothetical protein DPMN_169898 [Dreissena polymorpha]